MRTLRGRITAVTVVVAVIAVVITGLISLQLVRASTTQEARDQLSAQADVLAKVPRLASAAELSDKASLAVGGTQVALVRSDGQVEGAASAYVDSRILAALERGESVSTTRRGGAMLGRVMIEARPAQGGNAVLLALPLTSVDRALGAATMRILIALGIGLVVAIVGGSLLARRLSRPLTETAAAARRLASGERGVRMPGSPTTEIAAVTDALASLDAALVTSEARQREFLLSISHELRTPLTAVRGYAEAMADGLVPPADVLSVGATLVAETERLDRFVGDLLELARLEADDFTIAHAATDVTALLTEAATAWQGRAASAGVLLEVSAAGYPISTDARRVRQVIDGLIENALRVSPAGSMISLRLVQNGRTRIEVQDGGPGFAPEDLAVAFDRGVLRARYRDIRPVGTGLGLSIASRLVARLGGTISVANAPGGGAVFTVELP
ncbi:MAG: HAMP domain-containing histidine kinase [Salinibacterium sp.]|nr:MAG: HAMP domain-containing histidine kinase [Salinibacterium sp.]